MVSNLEKSNVSRRINKRIQDISNVERVARSPSINTTNRIASIRKQQQQQKQRSPVKIDRQKSLYRSMRGTLRNKINTHVEKTIMKKHSDYTIPKHGDCNTPLKKNSSDKMLDVINELRNEQYKSHKKITNDLRLAIAASAEVKVAGELLFCNRRIGAFEDELQNYNVDGCEFASNYCVESLSIESLRVPLVWKDYLKNQGDHRRFSVFVVVQIGPFVEKSEMITPIDRTHADFIFKRPIQFEAAPVGSDIKFEFYSHLIHRDVSIASTSQKIKHHLVALSDNVGRRVSRRLSGFVGPKFTLFGTSCLTSESTKNKLMKSYTLNSTRVKDGLPIFSSFCCKITRGPARKYSSIFN